MKIPYTMTNESITVICNGNSITVKEGATNFRGLQSALLEKRWNDVSKYLTVAKGLESWAKGKFSVTGNKVRYNNKDIPDSLSARISEMAKNGEDPTILFNFWEKLQENPSHRSVNQLWDFLLHQHIPLTADGDFLAYKAVTTDFKDHYTGRINNAPGAVNRMPRNEISDDPDHGCHVGFHVGAIAYAQNFHSGNSKIIVCKVNPAHVVCVPKDESFKKMRVCEYKVIGNYGSELPSTTFTEETPIEADEDGGGDKTDFVDAHEDPDTVVVKRKSKKGFARFDKMDMSELMDQSIADLRHYAAHGLTIVGASKIPGGKTALVVKILEVRA